MGSINNVLFSMFPSCAASVTGTGIAPATTSTNSGYGEAVELSLSQQQNSDGSDLYNVSLYGYSPSTSNQLISRNASGNTAQGAFETMMSSLSGLGIQNESGSAANDLLDQFNELDANLTENFGAGTGSVSTSKGFENTPEGPQSCNSSSVTANFSSTGQPTSTNVSATPLTPEQMQHQFQAPISSLIHNPMNQMTDGQTMSYIFTVVQSLQATG